MKNNNIDNKNLKKQPSPYYHPSPSPTDSSHLDSLPISTFCNITTPPQTPATSSPNEEATSSSSAYTAMLRKALFGSDLVYKTLQDTLYTLPHLFFFTTSFILPQNIYFTH
ncbi:hypothetical protein Tco_0654672 [Tanacetum coccineum]|uniref:Uncharacterized protein n=1 Tax=Tanacetum coccineum TaxID=301880 RepID=A0ABQ4X4D4_9ASTR